MVSKLARSCRCDDVLRHFSNRQMTFFTFTTPDVVTYSEIRARWRNLRHFLVEKYANKDLKYVMNFELHPKGHGWHIHCVFNDFINLRGNGIYKLRSFGFGMIRAEKVTTFGVANYLSKHCLKAYRGVQLAQKGQGKRLRLVNCSRGLPRLSDYHWVSQFQTRVKRFHNLVAKSSAFSKMSFSQRYNYSSFAVLQGWTVADLSLYLFQGRSKISSSL